MYKTADSLVSLQGVRMGTSIKSKHSLLTCLLKTKVVSIKQIEKSVKIGKTCTIVKIVLLKDLVTYTVEICQLSKMVDR